jgi:hypothetical protein
MNLNSRRIATRDKLILAGLFLSKYDATALKKLGFESFAEAFNVIGYALGAKPASIKNYRDEFDPFFPNQRKGWHKRPLRDHCRRVLEAHKDTGLETFSSMVKALIGYDDNAWSELKLQDEEQSGDSFFAKRLITGLAAEHYFELVQPNLPQFQGYALENTTRFGCGYDFRLRSGNSKDFLVIEVKGLQGRTGSLSLTPKEYEVAGSMAERFYLFVVKNFRESPIHDIYQNPLEAGLQFTKKERVVVQVSWLANV